MKPVVNLRWSVLGVALLCTVGAASALTLGRPRSVVLLGQPLELIVPVQFGADEEASASCFDADVFYGDIRLERSRVSVSAQPSAQSQSVNVRVFARGGVDEPVVTVYFRAGCADQTTRRYVLLADLATETEAPVVTTPPAGKTAVVPAASGKQRVVEPKSRVGLADSVPQTGVAPALRQAKAVDPTPPSIVLATPHREVKSVVQPTLRQRARLKLAPLDLSVERDPVLRSSDILPGVPAEDLERRAQAVATWRALNTSPEEILRLDARVLSMGGDLKSLRDLTEKNNQALVAFSGRLERSEAQRFNNPLVYGLALGLLVCLGFIVFIVWRLRTGGANAAPWWWGSGTAQRADGPAVDERVSAPARANLITDLAAESTLAATTGYAHREPIADMPGVDIDLEVRDSEYSRLVRGETHVPVSTQVVFTPVDAPVVGRGHQDFSQSVTASLRAINTQEMLDVRQQAEFFMTLGQHEEAIHLLADSIQNSTQSNPLVYLDLLKVLHTLSRKAEYDRYREVFNAIFSGRVPAYAHFFQQGHGLDAYEDVCQHIASLWPSEGALHFIEQCLVHSHDVVLAHEFDLEAFRDLLTLHGVLRRLISSDDSGLVPFSTFKSQALTQNVASSVRGSESDAFAHDQTVPVYPTAEAEMGVDLDLSESAKNLLEFEDLDLSLTPLDNESKSRA